MQALTPDQLGNLAVTNVKFPENGYLYVYVCDESAMDVYFDNLQIIHYTNPLTEVNDYYPFGLLAKTSTSLGGTPQNYKYNGKELQRDLAFNVEDYGARQYDPVSWRWLQVDPLAEKYRRYSPYNYALDNPVRFIDPDGQDAWDVVAGIGIGILTDLIPGTSAIRDLYPPDDAADFNDALQLTDATMEVVGSAMVKAGGGTAAAGVVVLETAGTVEVVSGGSATPVAAPAAVVGATMVGAGVQVATAGALLMSNAASNAGQGYDRGKKGDLSNPKKEAREQGKLKRENQPASEKYAKDKGKQLEKSDGKDARRKAHDAKEKGSGERTKKQIDEDYKTKK